MSFNSNLNESMFIFSTNTMRTLLDFFVDTCLRKHQSEHLILLSNCFSTHDPIFLSQTNS